MSDHRGYHNCPIDRLENELETDKIDGVSSSRAAEKLLRDGKNELEKPRAPTFCELFLSQMMNVIMLLLIGAAVASLVSGYCFGLTFSQIR